MDCIQLSLFGKTYQEPFPATTERTSGQFWKNLPAWSNQTLLFLDLRGGGRWSKAGAIAGNGWSLAWRQLDAQYWGKTIYDSRTGSVLRMGTPQRRKRIALVADFGGQRAGEILFEREGLQGHFDESVQTREEATGFTGNCPSGNDSMAGEVIPINTQIATRYKSLGERTGLGVGESGDPAYTLQATHEHGVCYCIQGNVADRLGSTKMNGAGVAENVSYTLNTVAYQSVVLRRTEARWLHRLSYGR